MRNESQLADSKIDFSRKKLFAIEQASTAKFIENLNSTRGIIRKLSRDKVVTKKKKKHNLILNYHIECN